MKVVKIIYSVVIVFFVIMFSTSQAFAGNHQPPTPCTGNPDPEPIMIIEAELLINNLLENVVRLQWNQSLCSTEFQVQRQDYIGNTPLGYETIFNADRDFNLQFITRVPPNDSVFFLLDESVIQNTQYDYRVLAKTQNKESRYENGTIQYSPIVSIDTSVIRSQTMRSNALVVVSTTITPITVSYEGNTPIQNLFLDLGNWIVKALNPDLYSLFIGWAFAEDPFELWESVPNPQNEAVLFFIEPTPNPDPTNEYCQAELYLIYRINQVGGQEIDFTVTLLDYPTVIHQETFNTIMRDDRSFVANFFIETTDPTITDYSNVYVQINANGLTGSDSSLIIHDIIFLVPEDQSAC